MADDIQRAADVLHPLFEASGRRDGFVSFELEPALLHGVPADRGRSAPRFPPRRPLQRHGRDSGHSRRPRGHARVVADGVSVNVTHLFSVADYEKAAGGLPGRPEQYLTSHSVWRTAPTAVASFSLAPLDAAVDARLEALGRPDLRGKAAVALARRLYRPLPATVQRPGMGQAGGATRPAAAAQVDAHNAARLRPPRPLLHSATHRRGHNNDLHRRPR
jgi:hypothetical protein